MNLFIREDFISHAGLPLTWKVECDALSEGDYEALAKIVVKKLNLKMLLVYLVEVFLLKMPLNSTHLMTKMIRC